MSAEEIRVAQEQVIGKVRQAILEGLWPPSKEKADPNFVFLWREKKKVEILNGLLYMKISKLEGRGISQLLLPEQ